MIDKILSKVSNLWAGEAKVIVSDFAESRSTPKRLLVLKLDHLGDFIMALPAMEYLRRTFAEAEITLICGSWNTQIAKDCGLFDRIASYDYFPQNAAGWNGRPVQDLAEFKRQLNARYDVAIDLRPSEDTRFLLQHVNANFRCGFGTKERFPYLDLAMMQEFENRNGASGGDKIFPIYFRPEHFSSKLKLNGHFALEIDFSTTNENLVWGPYYALPAGRYRATFGLDAEGVVGGAPGYVQLDVARDQGKAVARQRFSFDDLARFHAGEVEIEFDNPQTDAVYEFRLAASGKPSAGKLKFRGVRLEPTGDATQSTWRSSQIHKGEHMLLLACLVVERLRAPPLQSANLIVTSAEDDLRLPSGVNIILAPFSNSPLRDWPSTNYSKLIGLLLARTDYNILIVGARGQDEQADRLIKGHTGAERIINMVGHTEWRSMPAILLQAGLVVCNNSGLAHMAAAIGASTLAIYSGSHEPSEWGPRGKRVRTMTAKVPCAPCGIDELSACKADHLCMRAITPDAVFKQVQSSIQDKRYSSATSGAGQ